MKLCKDCKHFNEHPPGTIAPLCVHPSAPREPVYGYFYSTCSLMRSENCLVQPACGPTGEWFEQMEPESKPSAMVFGQPMNPDDFSPPTYQSSDPQNSPYLGGHVYSWAPSEPVAMDPACEQRRSWWQRIFGA